MKTNRTHWIVVALAALAGTSLVSLAAERRRSGDTRVVTPAPKPTVSPNQGFEFFQIVAERNIFNPSRVGRVRETTEDKSQRIDEISLVGTVRYDANKLAIFDSPNAAYRKAVPEGGDVADFKVQTISAEGVKLMREDKPLTLKVAQQLRRVEGADWTVTLNKAVQIDPKALAPSSSKSSSSTAATPAAAELPADASEVLKRLMQKREKQLKQ